MDRDEKVKGFTLDVDIDSAVPDYTPTEDEESVPVEQPKDNADASAEPTSLSRSSKKRKKRSGCLKRLIYLAVVLAIAVAISTFAIIFLIDAVGIDQSGIPIDVEIPMGSSTQQIAEILEENGVINNAFCFRIFSRISGADGKYQLGVFSLSSDMGYGDIVEVLQTATPRDSVTITIPEGFTVEEIAELLDKNGVCDKRSFYDAVADGIYDYDFVKNLPTVEGRVYRLEGYLFPDTYNFFKDSTGEYAVGVMLKNFDKKIDGTIRAQIAETGMSMDEAIIMASIIQGEAASFEDMTGVSRVFLNRREENSGYPKMESCATRDYVRGIKDGLVVTTAAYNTYERVGLPVGAINNPGLDAIKALLHPSEDPEMMKCYFFATDYTTGITYFSKTFAQHEAICRRYKIGAYG